MADMEGVVSDRAHQLISSTVAAVKVPTVKVPSVNTIPPVWGSQPVGKEPPPQPQMGMSRFHKTVVPNAVSTAGTPDDESDIEFDETEDDKLKVSVAIHPYGVMFQKASVQPSDKTARAEQKVQTSLLTSRSIDWSSIQTGQRAVSGKTSRLISANGGASTPHDASNQSPFATGHATGPTRSNGRTYQHGDSSNIIPTDPQSFSHVSHQTPMTQRPPTYPVSSQSADLTSAVVQPSGRPTPQESSNADALRAPQRISPRRPYPDDDDDVTLMEKMGRFVPRIKLPFRLNPFQRGMSRDFENAALDAWRADEEASRAEGGGFFGFFTRKQSDLDSIPRYVQSKEQKDVITAPVADLIERCGKGEASSLLNAKEEDRCRSIGRQKAVFDLLFLAFMLAGTQHLPDDGRVFRLPRSVVEALTTGVTDLLNLVAASTETWSPYAFVSAFLAVKTRSLLCDKKERALAAEAESSIREESQYGSLFLRVVSSVAVERNMPKKMEAATRAQIASKVDIARLQAFVIGILASFILMAVSVLRPLSTELIRAFGQLLNLEQLHVWPPQRRAIADGFKTAFTPLLSNAGALVGDALHGFVDSPLRHAYKTSILAALAAVSFLPILEGKRRHPCNLGESEIDGEEGETEMYLKFTEHVANLGASGANRLGLMAVDGGVDSVLERWRSMIPRKSFDSQINVAFKSVVRLACYGAVSCFLLSGPLLLYKYMDISKAGSTKSFLPRWDSLFDVSFVLFFTHYLVWESLLKTVRAGDVKVKIMGFVTALASVADERKKLLAAPPSNLQMQSVSPTAGVTVRDLWASHVTKRAWAVRGANLSCRSGEILALLGDDGAGKTRLITVLAESMVSPSRRALSAQRVRGSVAVGGLDVSKWDSRQLRRRLGISVHDVRSVIDTAHILTGLSLDEILDPSARIRNFDPSRSPGPSERAAMMLALNITGLYSSLLQRLPSKMATLVTASEEDLHPSSLRPRYQILSQAEWSKILLARVLAQAIYDNENSAGAHDAIVNSLVGSVLLLDDLTLHLSEAEEARLLQDLRKSGAATVITSNRWATGRFADRIAVIKDGAIVETGTHSELLNRGPQQSIYAAKWHAMTSISPA